MSLAMWWIPAKLSRLGTCALCPAPLYENDPAVWLVDLQRYAHRSCVSDDHMLPELQPQEGKLPIIGAYGRRCALCTVPLTPGDAEIMWVPRISDYVHGHCLREYPNTARTATAKAQLTPLCPTCRYPLASPPPSNCNNLKHHHTWQQIEDKYMTTKDTTPKHVVADGATRSEKAPPYHLVPGDGHKRTALRFGLGAEIHGPWNWLNAVKTPESAYAWAYEAYNHMMEHARKMAAGLNPEDDHLGAIGWAQEVLCHIEALYNCKWTELRELAEKHKLAASMVDKTVTRDANVAEARINIGRER